MCIRNCVAVFLVCVALTPPVLAAMTAEQAFPAEPDPFLGNYTGRWGEKEEVNPAIAAQVFGLGGNLYHIRLVNKLNMRCPPLVEIDVEAKNGVLEFKTDRYYGRCDGEAFTGGRDDGKVTFNMAKRELLSPTLGKEPPGNAIVLFDGTNLDAWTDTKGWEILDSGAMMVNPKAGQLHSKQAWLDAYLHIEFRLPYMPHHTGQQRGNSGVFLQDTYEVQILDSFGLEGYYNECGALYKVSAPHVNACAPPLQWQTYDIEYRAPRYNADGELLSNGRMTVYHNGVLIHNDQELWWITGWKEKDRNKPAPSEPKPIRIQCHGDHIQFRNIWLVDMGPGG